MGAHNERGVWAEQLALTFLQQQGLALVEKNFRGPGGEVDLIMQDHNTIAFIEVRYRAMSHFASALESIDQKKCERIIKTSLHYLQSHRDTAKNACRFDVITVTGATAAPEIGWIKNAFQA